MEQDPVAPAPRPQEETVDWDKIANYIVLAMLLCTTVFTWFGFELAKILFGLSFIVATVLFLGHLMHWVVLGIHGPGWIHPVDYLKRSLQLRILLVGIVCAFLVRGS